MDKLRFLHIPKTAGSTFIDCLKRLYSQGEYFGFTGNVAADHEKYHRMAPEKRENIVLVWGHSPRITGLPQIDVLPTVTFLRHPVRRVKSFCQHVSEGKSPYLQETFPPETFNLEAFLASGNGELENMHARLLLGREGYELPEMEPEKIIDSAVEILTQELKAFGIQEQYNLSLLLFRRTFGWRQWPVYRVLNQKNPSKLIQFSGVHIAKIKSLNEIDLAIYERAHQIFSQRLAQHAAYIRRSKLVFEIALKFARIGFALQDYHRTRR